MKEKKKVLKLLLIISLIIFTVISVVFGGYLIIDKVIVPKYLKNYGINDLDDLVTMIGTMYNTPNEEKFISKPYTESNKISAFNTLKNANFPVAIDGQSIDYNKVAEQHIEIILPEGENTLEFTDREIASVLDDILKSGVLVTNLEEIKSLDTLSMSVKEVIITPRENSKKSANVKFTVMLDTENVREDLAKKMDVPLFMLNMIVPEELYFTCEYNLTKLDDGQFIYQNCEMSINGSTSKQSEILINLLIDFIFEDEMEMTAEKLIVKLGGTIEYGLSLIGEFEFSSNLGVKNNQTGLIVYIN